MNATWAAPVIAAILALIPTEPPSIVPTDLLGCSPSGDPMGLPIPGEPQEALEHWVVVIDGKPTDLLPGELDDTVMPDIGMLEIICWRAAKRIFDMDVLYGVVSAWSAPGPMPEIHGFLESVAGAQQAYLDEQGQYATESEALDLSGPDGVLGLAVTSGGDRWEASFRPALVNHECTIEGGLEPSGELVVSSPACTSRHDHLGSGS